MTEIVPYPADPRYGVTRDGRVFRIEKAKFGRAVPYQLQAYLNGAGYRCVGIGDQPTRVHRIVAETFLPNPDGKPIVAHWDGSRTNNAVENLRWATQKENMADADRHGTIARGERSGGAVLTEGAVREMKTALSNGARGIDLARQFSISQQTVCDIKMRRKWAHV